MTSPRPGSRPLAAVSAVAVAALGLLGLLPLPLLAAEPAPAAPPAAESFRDSIQVSVVNLDVFVTDKQGKPVTGLQKEDFTVLEDGKPVTLSNFYAETGGETPVAAAAPGGAAARGADQRLHLVIFVDDVNIEPPTRGRILDRLAEFLRRDLVPGDEVMLVRYSGSLETRRSFTSDLGQINADIAALGKLSSDMRKYEASRDHALEDIIDAIEAGDGWGPLAEGRIRAWSEQESAVVRGALRALDGVVTTLAGVPGRKALLYVSDGLPLQPGEDLFTWANLRSAYRAGRRISALSGREFDLSKQFRAVTAHASRNRIAFYPIEGYGVRAENGGSNIQQIVIKNRQDGLRFLAADTGGQALLNASDPLAALRPMSEDLKTYYSLGYQPQRAGDEAEHKIEVRLKAKGMQLRYRQWYRDKPVSELVAERTLAAMRFGGEENPLGASVEVVPGRKPGETMVRVKVPLARLFLEPQGDSRQGSLRLYVVASGEGQMTAVRETRLATITVPEAEAASGKMHDYTHEIAIALPAGSYTLGLGVRDEKAAATSYLHQDFAVAPPAAPAAAKP